ncbi:hypothetical protein T484DRAFT_1815037 [Baffinella frigidus]|nr:hypothetical protein T484DRAFT_1815037 [Cryptophyta sp. CCMP2293]
MEARPSEKKQGRIQPAGLWLHIVWASLFCRAGAGLGSCSEKRQRMFGLLRTTVLAAKPCVVVNGSNEASTWLTQSFSVGQDFTVGLCKKPENWGSDPSTDGEWTTGGP